MGTEIVDQVVKRLSSLPPLPAAVQQLCEMTGDTESSYDKMAEVIATDEVLTTKILRVANSSFYGLSQQVSTVSNAVVVVGFHGIRSLAIGITVFGFKAGVADACPLRRDSLWRHSLAVASGARLLASHFQIRNWEEVFVAGMLHDIGKIIFMECFHDKYTRVLQEAATGSRSLEDLEIKAFGMDHAALGGELCRRWKMPAPLTDMVAMHHQATERRSAEAPQARMLDTIRVADNLARIARIGSDGNPNVERIFLGALHNLDLPSEQLHDFILTLPNEVRQIEEFFDLPAEKPDPLKISPRSAAAGVALKDPGDQEVVQAALCALGYSPVSLKKTTETPGQMVAAIADDSLSKTTGTALKRQGVQPLDFSRWRKENASDDEAIILNVVGFQSWFSEQVGSP
jgi:putative nucleotidyltransferase with HDIG domain